MSIFTSAVARISQRHGEQHPELLGLRAPKTTAALILLGGKAEPREQHWRGNRSTGILLRRESDPTEGEDRIDLLRGNTFPSPSCFVLPWAAGDSLGGHGDPLLQETFPWVLELQRGMLGHCLLPIGLGALGWPSTSWMGRERWDEQDTEPAPMGKHHRP